MSPRLWMCKLLLVLLQLYKITAYATLSDEALTRSLAKPNSADFDIHNGSLLAPILIPRVAGTEGSRKVLNHFVDYFRSNLPEWTIAFQNSTSKTPVHGDQEIPFVNFVATRDPPWSTPGNVGRLTLVAHYDSKYTPEGFIGAIDSAAPCAMVMHAVRAIDNALSKKWVSMQSEGLDVDFQEDKGIQVLFLDGEEAFLSWNDHDSLYGARSLAHEWDGAMNPAMSTYKTMLDNIELFVLLDLLGSSEDTPVPSWMHNSHWSYVKLAELEQRLRRFGMFKSNPQRTWLSEKDKTDSGVFRSYTMQDDHIPFVARGVNCLHLIPARFPSVWHTMNDDGEHLDIPTVEDWSLLMSAFTAEYLELGNFLEEPKREKRQYDDVISKTEL